MNKRGREEKKMRRPVAIFTAVAFLLLGYALFLTWQWGDCKENLTYLILSLYLLYSPLIVLAFFSWGLGGGVSALIFSSLFGQLTFAATNLSPHHFPSFFLLITGATSYFFLKKEQNFQRQNEIIREELESSYRLLQEKQVKNISGKKGWQKRILKYSLLREITESFSFSLNREEISHLVTDSALYLIEKGEMALLFLVEEGKMALRATTSLSGQSKGTQPGEGGDSTERVLTSRTPRVKSKAGDVFDEWVLKQRQSLIIADGEKDFRFRTRSGGEGERKVRALISSPLFWRKEVRGLLRLDSSAPDKYKDSDLRLLNIVANLTSLALENAELYQKTEELAIRDDLTGLYVHKHFQERLEEELKRALAQDYPLSLVMLDIDRFKDYNDRFGHVAGDIVLRHLAKILRKETAPGNFIARYGGEEFSLLLPRIDKEEACRLAERICGKVARHAITLRRIKTRITVSLGVATFPEDARTKNSFIQKADEALYRAKKKGRNQVCI